MGFIRKGGAFQLLNSMETGKCAGKCRSVWLRNIQYALKTPSNPLKLTATEHKRMTDAVNEVKGHRHRRRQTTQKHTKASGVTKKYLSRPSPPLPANEHCGETRKGNDGQLYIAVPNKQKVCRWTLKADGKKNKEKQ